MSSLSRSTASRSRRSTRVRSAAASASASARRARSEAASSPAAGQEAALGLHPCGSVAREDLGGAGVLAAARAADGAGPRRRAGGARRRDADAFEERGSACDTSREQ